jgi:hypothetical protein
MSQATFEDTLGTWRAKTRPGLEELRGDLLDRLLKAWPPVRGEEAPPRGELESAARVVMHEAAPEAAERFAAAAVEHVEQSRQLERPAEHDAVCREVSAAFRLTAQRPALVFPPPFLRTPAVMWAVPAAVGAVLGVFIFPPLAWLLWGDRQIGLVLGGPIGAALLVLLAALVAERPRVRVAVQVGLGALAVSEVAGWLTSWGRIWAWLGLGSQTLWHRVRRILLWVAAIFALQLTRARAVLKREDAKTVAAAQVELLLRAHLDHLLALAWMHPDLAPVFRGELTAAGIVPDTGVLEALSKMRRFVEHEEAAADLLIAAREAVEALELSGLEMREYPDGQPFEPQMKDYFDLLYPLEEGAPVRTLKPAILLHGRAVVRGHLDRSRRRR